MSPRFYKFLFRHAVFLNTVKNFAYGGYRIAHKFGARGKEYVERYENGERYFARDKRWIHRDEDARLHYDIRNGWVISTEHYDVHTNHSWEEGVQTARQLEHLNRAWRMLFFNMLYTENKLASLILNPPGTAVKHPRHRVFLYRDKADYDANLKALEDRIERSNGYYSPITTTAYFFPASEDMEAFVAESTRHALFHEATHQLFQEAKSGRNQDPAQTNYWLVEGMAMFMETFRMDKKHYKLGDLYHSRLVAANLYFVRDKFFMPTATLTRFGAEDFPKNLYCYAQSAALTHYLMFAHAGRDRAALLELLRTTYSGAARANTLEKLLGRPFEEIDREYREFLRAL